MKLIFTVLLLLSIHVCYSQTGSQVTTYATGLGSVRGLDFDSKGNLFVASGNNILKITPAGDKTTFDTETGYIWELKIDSIDNIFFAQNTQIIKMDMQGNKTVIANQSGYWYQGIAFDGKGNVSLKIYNLLGKEIATLINEEKNAGTHSVKFDAANLPSGIYFSRLLVGNFTETKKMSLLK